MAGIATVRTERNNEPVSLTTMGGLLEHARVARDLPELIDIFTASIAVHGFNGHLCVARDGGVSRPLFGHHALDAGWPVLTLPVASWSGVRCAIRLAGRNTPVDTALRASLAGRAEVYATFGFAALQRQRDIATTTGLGLVERQCLAGLLLGQGEGAIAARLAIDPLTVAGHIESATARLGVATRVEAVALAARRGLLAGFPADCRISLSRPELNHS